MSKDSRYLVEIRDLVHEFVDTDENGEITNRFRAVDGVTMEVKKGDFIAVLGHNGSGKSTIAKHINAILTPTEGTVYVGGTDTSKEENLWEVRQKAGMVFQNPDNQIIATIVEEDVGFGPENLGVPTEDIWKRVDAALAAVGMTEYRHHSPTRLSGGQKQRVAIAGVMAMHPECIVLDEPTAMLDPNGRREVLKTLKELNEKEKVTIILITHYMDEVINADKVFVMDSGKIALLGMPYEVFRETERIKALGLDVPQVTEINYKLRKKGFDLPDCVLDIGSFVEAVGKIKRPQECAKCPPQADGRVKIEKKGAPIIEIRNVNFIYSPDNAFRRQALKDVNITVNEGEFIGIIGHTGSGKSTLIQHMNGLMRATSGEIFYRGKNIYDEDFSMPQLRKKVGLVFQYPEYQLFETTVFEDVKFGPKNLGCSPSECEERAAEALKSVGADESLWKKSPFELSGGQKRRAAIAGILAMRPEVLILDEPTAALDPRGREEILGLIKKLHRENGTTIVLVSHSMEDVARYADRLIVMNRGSVRYDDTVQEVFKSYRDLEKIGLAAPQVTYLFAALERAGYDFGNETTTVDCAVDVINAALRGTAETE